VKLLAPHPDQWAQNQPTRDKDAGSSSRPSVLVARGDTDLVDGETLDFLQGKTGTVPEIALNGCLRVPGATSVLGGRRPGELHCAVEQGERGLSLNSDAVSPTQSSCDMTFRPSHRLTSAEST